MRQIRRVYFSAHPKTAASQPHTDYSRVDRVESVAPLDAKRPYSTLMFSRKERKGRKRKNWLIVAIGSLILSFPLAISSLR